MKLGILRRIPELHGLTDEQYMNMSSHFKPERFVRGDQIVSQGEEGNKLYLLMEGSVDCHRKQDPHNPHEKPTLERKYGGYDYFGERAIISETARQATITVTSERCEVLAIKGDIISRFVGPLGHLRQRNEH